MTYVLGLIYTDGNLCIRKYKSGYELGILSFAQKEKELVEKFLNLMKCDATIRFKKRRELNNTTAGELYYFNIGNNNIANDLKRLGITPNKSLEMLFPEIPDEHLRHFVRGLFDGDGSIYMDYGKYIRIKLLSGSFEFIDALNKKLCDFGFPLRKIYGGYQQHKNEYFIRYGTENALEFFKFIYKGVPEIMYYSKKYQRFINYFESKSLFKG